jgi:hypothetical protein
LDVVSDLSWAWKYWYIILGFEAFILMVAFCLRCGKENGQAVQNFARRRNREISGTVKRRAFGGLSVRGKKSAESGQDEITNLAMVRAEGEGLRRKSAIFGTRKKNLAFARLHVLFPQAKENVLKDMVEMSPHEEAAVARLLTLGYNMWMVEDYKLLNFGAKKKMKQGGVR